MNPMLNPRFAMTKRLAVLLLLSVSACSADLPAMMRRHTYPPNFKYIDRNQVSAAMWQLADASRNLDALMRQEGPIDETRRGEVLRLLRAMTDAANSLETQDQPTNHPVISDHLGQFMRDLYQARRGVEAEPPSYYLVGTVSGACLTCHSGN